MQTQRWLAAVDAAAAEGHRSLLQVYALLSAGGPQLEPEALLAAEAAVDAGAAAFGWDWAAFANIIAAARERLGERWLQPALEGQALCTDEFNLLRLLYDRSSSGGGTGSKQRWWWPFGGGSSSSGRGHSSSGDGGEAGAGTGGGGHAAPAEPSVAELFEGEHFFWQLAAHDKVEWVDFLSADTRAAPYDWSCAADVAMQAGQLAVLPSQGAVAVSGGQYVPPPWLAHALSTTLWSVLHDAHSLPRPAMLAPLPFPQWALPLAVDVRMGSAWWSPAFALGPDLW